MNEVFYREPDRCLHRALLNGVCTSCGAVQMMVVPVEIDYEAAEREWEQAGFEETPEHQVKRIVDAALRKGDE